VGSPFVACLGARPDSGIERLCLQSSDRLRDGCSLVDIGRSERVDDPFIVMISVRVVEFCGCWK
jgi:hypothetical protein